MRENSKKMVSIPVRLERKTKDQFYEACYEMGIQPGVAISVFCTKVAKTKKMPFDVSAEDE